LTELLPALRMIPLSRSKSIDTPRCSNVPGTPDGKRTALTNLSDDTDQGASL
jgi:hypothetical protein